MTNAFVDVTVVDLSVAPAWRDRGDAPRRVRRATSPGSSVRPDDAAPDDPLWRYANRTKKVVVGSDDGLRELSRTADVVVVDLPATELEAAGLGAAQLRAASTRR